VVELRWRWRGRHDDIVQYVAADEAESCVLQSLLHASFDTCGLFVVGNYLQY